MGRSDFNMEISQEVEVKISKGNNIYLFSKRTLDIVLSTIGLILLSPILLIVAILIRVESKGPIIFSQKRVGLNEKSFEMYKFRSMLSNAEELKKNLLEKNEMSGPMFKMKNDPRTTKIGKIIRRTSIDELPQLINVLKGEMSLVGPRPSLPNEVQEFEMWMLKRLQVKPGLTCYWQVAGRNSMDFEEWMRLDLKYVNDKKLLLDIELIFKTIIMLFSKDNNN